MTRFPTYPILFLALTAICATASAQSDSVGVPTDSTRAGAVPSTVNDASQSIQAQLRTIYGSLELFTGIQVDVKAGVVRLSGTVRDVEDIDRAEALAAKIPGVLFVINELETDSDIQKRVSPAVQEIQGYFEKLVAFLPVIAIALIVLILFWMLGRWAGRLEKPLAHVGIPPMLRTLIGRLVFVTFFTIGLVLALDILGISALVGTVLGAAGVAGIAIGFAFQDIVENYLAGILMSIRRPFSLNDHIRIGDVEGKVLSLSSRELLLMTLDGNHVRLPNATVFKGTIYNFTRNPRRRFDFSVGVGVEEDLVTVSELGLATLNAIPGIMDSPGPAMIIRELGDSNVVITFFAWVDQNLADFGKVRSAAIRLVKVAFDEAQISMPEPIYNVRMEDITVEDRRSAKTGEVQPRSEPTSDVLKQAVEADTGVVTELDEQIREDLDKSDERNYLKES